MSSATVTTPSAADNNAASTATNEIATLPPINSLLRFLYLSTNKNAYIKTRDVVLSNIQNQLACVVTMGQSRAILPLSVIKKAYQNKCLPRHDETLAALAFCARQNECPELRKLAYDEAITLIDTPADFLLFIKLCVEISVKINGRGHKGFGRGLKRVIGKWYEKYNAVELANIFGEHRSLYKWTHKDLWKLTHMKTTPVRQNSDDSATIIDTDREHVIKFIFKNGQEYLNYLSTITDPLGPGAQRMKNLQIFKTNENTTDAIKQIQENGFTLEQTPAHLLERVEIWDVLLPSISYRGLLKHLNTLKDLTFLNPNNVFAHKFVQALAQLNRYDREDARICPIYVFILKRLYEKNARYLETTKSLHYEKKITRRNVQTNEKVKEQLNILFEHLLINSQPAPATYFVTIDLRKTNLRRHILRNKHINCFEASVVLAYSILKREKGTMLYSYTENKDELLSLRDIPTADYAAALKYCQEKVFPKTQHSLSKPMKLAIEQKKKVDVFVVIVDSVARFCRQGQTPLTEFADYRKQLNDKAKFVVVNLDRPTPDLVLRPNKDSVGFFEICGFTQETPKIIHALGKHCFS